MTTARSSNPAFAALLLSAALVAGIACFGDDSNSDDGSVAGGSANGDAAVPRIREEEGLTTVQIAEKLAPSIVRIQTESAPGDVLGRVTPESGVGTGVIIDGDGHIVTNNHVVTMATTNEPVEKITVTLSDQRTVDARIVGHDQATDLAVLQIDEDGLTAASFGDAAALKVGQDVVAIGFALNLEGAPSVTRGVISATNRTIDEQPYTIPDVIQTDASINPGNSGGPLVNALGEVIGINTAIVRGAQSIGFSISASLVEPTVATLIEKGRIDRAFLGVGTVDVTETIARNFNLPVDNGIVVTIVADGSPAAAVGLQVNDVIVSIDGQEIANNGEFLALLAERQPGDTVTIEYYRDGERRTAEAMLTERPEG